MTHYIEKVSGLLFCNFTPTLIVLFHPLLWLALSNGLNMVVHPETLQRVVSSMKNIYCKDHCRYNNWSCTLVKAPVIINEAVFDVGKNPVLEYWSVLCVAQVMKTVHGRAAWPMSAERCSSKPSITCWNAASWTDPLFVSASGSSNPTRRMRSPSTKGNRHVVQTAD